jgi:hypothetical protein
MSATGGAALGCAPAGGALGAGAATVLPVLPATGLTGWSFVSADAASESACRSFCGLPRAAAASSWLAYSSDKGTA